MKKLISIVVVLICAISVFAQDTKKHVVIISIDGLRPEFYLDKRFDTPNLKKLVSEGAYAKGVESVFPSVTYPSHTTMVTGVNPARHGIVSNTKFKPKLAAGEWYKEASLIKVKTLWDAAKKRSLVTSSVYWPTTVGAKIDYLIPEVWVEEDLINAEELTQLSTKGLIDEIKVAWEKQLEDKTMLDPTGIKEKADILITFASSYIIKKYKPNLHLMHLLSCDKAQHATGKESETTSKAIASVDKLIGVILDSIKASGIEENTAVMIVGDHGFADYTNTISPNILLINNGLLEIWHARVKNWFAWAHTSGSVAAVYLSDKDDAEVQKEVREIFEECSTYKGQQIYHIYDREQLAKLGAYPDAFMVLEAIPPYTMAGDVGGDFVKAIGGTGGMHGYLPTREFMFTGFITRGAGIKKGAVLDKMKLLDIAPTVSKLLGLDMKNMEGRILTEILK